MAFHVLCSDVRAYLFCKYDCIVIILYVALIFSTCVDEVPIRDGEAKLISEFVKSIASMTTSEFQKENSTFGSLSGDEGDVSKLFVLLAGSIFPLA